MIESKVVFLAGGSAAVSLLNCYTSGGRVQCEIMFNVRTKRPQSCETDKKLSLL